MSKTCLLLYLVLLPLNQLHCRSLLIHHSYCQCTIRVCYYLLNMILFACVFAGICEGVYTQHQPRVMFLKSYLLCLLREVQCPDYLFIYYCVEYMCSSVNVCQRERLGSCQRAICRNQGSFSACCSQRLNSDCPDPWSQGPLPTEPSC